MQFKMRYAILCIIMDVIYPGAEVRTLRPSSYAVMAANAKKESFPADGKLSFMFYAGKFLHDPLTVADRILATETVFDHITGHRRSWKQRRTCFQKVPEKNCFGAETTKNARKLSQITGFSCW